ncbi:hypothetical protein M440DRAFT_1306424, partial [Trichoderma longibrachiatum ATCC 18648]
RGQIRFEISASLCTPRDLASSKLLWQPGGEGGRLGPSQPYECEPQVSNPFARIQPQSGAPRIF